MKRILTLMLAVLLLLTACGTPTPPAEPPQPVEPSTPVAPEVPAEPGKEWETLNVLMIGNSFCYNFVQELHAMAYLNGYKLNLCNLYHAGCSVESHWKWLNDNQPNFMFYITDTLGRRKLVDITTAKAALAYLDWDVISFQQHFYPERSVSYETALASCTPYVKDYYDYLKANHPNAKLYWQQTWAYEVGHKYIPDTAAQTNQHENIRLVSRDMCEENGVSIVPTGEAWALARANPLVGDTLCMDDNCHDGDIGGGQYLNACVWLETLMGKSCVGNTWRPIGYELEENKLLALQGAAHAAVAAAYGEDYAEAVVYTDAPPAPVEAAPAVIPDVKQASGPIAEVTTGDTTVTVNSVEDLVSAIHSSGLSEVKLLQDIRNNNTIVLPYSCTIDFAGHTIMTNPKQGNGLQVQAVGTEKQVTTLKNGTVVHYVLGVRVNAGGIVLSNMTMQGISGACVGLYDTNAAYKSVNLIEDSTLSSGEYGCVAFNLKDGDFSGSGLTIRNSTLVSHKDGGKQVFVKNGAANKPGTVTLGENVNLYSYGYLTAPGYVLEGQELLEDPFGAHVSVAGGTFEDMYHWMTAC